MSFNIRQKKILFNTEDYIKQHFSGEGSGHDWWHIFRVRNMARKVSEKEGGDLFIIEMGALLHDLEDWKLNHTQNTTCKRVLEKVGASTLDSNKIIEVCQQVSFKGAGVPNKATSIEAQIVQDADRLDAIGAIGIARTFVYGGNKNRPIYEPETKPVLHTSFKSYKNNTAPTINHFYEKLLLLKDRLNTETAINMAVERHRFMEDFLSQFFNEWENKI